MPDAVSVKGDAAAARKLRAIGTRAQHQRTTFEREARAAQRRVVVDAVDTGRLQRSVRGGSETLRDVDDRGYRIGSKVPYARFVFGGTERMAARPPKVPADLGRRAAESIGVDLRRA